MPLRRRNPASCVPVRTQVMKPNTGAHTRALAALKTNASPSGTPPRAISAVMTGTPISAPRAACRRIAWWWRTAVAATAANTATSRAPTRIPPTVPAASPSARGAKMARPRIANGRERIAEVRRASGQTSSPPPLVPARSARRGRTCPRAHRRPARTRPPGRAVPRRWGPGPGGRRRRLPAPAPPGRSSTQGRPAPPPPTPPPRGARPATGRRGGRRRT